MKKKIALIIYISLCLSVLVFSFIQRDIKDTDLAVVYFMLVLTIPSGFALSSVLAGFYYFINNYLTITVPGGFYNNIFIWFSFAVVGYLQWFKLVPWASKHITRRSSETREKASRAP